MILGNVALSVIRRGPQTNVNYVAVPGVETVTNYTEADGFSVQPLNNADLRLLEQRNIKAARYKICYPADIDIRTISNPSDIVNNNPDLIEFEGVRHYVYATRSYGRNMLLGSARCYLVEAESAGGPT